MTTSQTQSALGKKILITGGTSGVGLETARQLVAVGADVMVVGSGASKGEEAERSLNEAVGTGHATFVAADLSSLRFFMPFSTFSPPAIPRDLDTYLEFRRLSIKFTEARNRRIDQLALDVD